MSCEPSPTPSLPCASGGTGITLAAVPCRPGCGACCIAPSISSPLPGLPSGKPAGTPCPHLDPGLRCRLFGQAERPGVCASLSPSRDMCGDNREQAMHYLTQLEQATRPGH